MAELYNEGLFRKGLVRTSGLVRPDLLLTFDDIFSPYAIDRLEAALALDFDSNVYRTGNKDTTFADAFMGNSPKLTYNPGSASSSQSTMTQGYGPELVTNGGFDTDTDWDTGTGWTINTTTGVASHAAGSSSNLDQNMPLVTGAAYEIQLTLSNVSAGAAQVYLQGSAAENVSAPLNSNGNYSFTLVAGTASSYDFRVNGSSTFVGSIDNISIREAPKIVWAPHNLVEYSDDLVSGATAYSSLTIDTADTFTFTADTSYIRLQQGVGVAPKGKYTARVYISGDTPGDTFNIELVDDADGSDSNTTNVTVSTTPQWVEVTADFSGSSTFSGTLGLYINRTSANRSVTAGSTVTIKHIHLYRSDLGGMAPVPGAEGDFQYYVPTNGAAVYLPRVGHHVYNGSTWVNEGLLIESEPRTNLFTHSEDFTDASWFKGETDTLALDAIGPDGATSAVTFTDSGATGTGSPRVAKVSQPVAASTAYTFSVFAKADQLSWIALRTNGFTTPSNGYTYFNLSSGAVGTVHSDHSASIQDFGDGWHRCWITFTTDAVDTSGELYVHLADGDSDHTVDLDGTSSILIYGAQLEAASTPSSYIPTNGSTVTRGAQSLTVPANWYDADNPTPTGPELVTNGGFATDLTGWTDFSEAGGSVAQSGFGLAMTTGADGTQEGKAYQAISTAVGSVYRLTATKSGAASRLDLDPSNQFGAGILIGDNTTTDVDVVFTATSATTYVNARNLSSFNSTAYIDNISVRQVSAPQFGWPEPEYIGPELVDNGGFDTDTVWTDQLGASTGGTVVITGGELVITQGSNSVWMGATQGIDVTGVDYIVIEAELVSRSTGGAVRVGLHTVDTAPATPNLGYMALTEGSNTVTLDVSGSSGTVYLVVMDGQGAGANSHVANISVREINPLSVSIQMDGRMTYADENSPGEVYWLVWDGTSDISMYYATDGAYDRTKFVNGNVIEQNDSGSQTEYLFSPGNLVPFNIAGRFGSTFVNGAVNGVAMSGDTTPTALPDLSNTNLQIAQDFMGTIGTFRQFAGDIGDAGLVTATNPSTEPTLSLTFDGTEGSFYNLNWSE